MNTPTPHDRLVKPVEAAVLLAVCRRTLRRYAAQGKLQRVHLNSRAIRYRLQEVMRLAHPEVTPCAHHATAWPPQAHTETPNRQSAARKEW